MLDLLDILRVLGFRSLMKLRHLNLWLVAWFDISGLLLNIWHLASHLYLSHDSGSDEHCCGVRSPILVVVVSSNAIDESRK